MTAKETYKEALDKLHQLELAGKDQTDEAEEIRNALDEPWFTMTDDERDEMEEYSAKLNEICEKIIEQQQKNEDL